MKRTPADGMLSALTLANKQVDELSEENNKLRAENDSLKLQVMTLGQSVEKLRWRLVDLHAEHEHICRSLTDDMRRQIYAHAVIEDDNITSAEDLSQRVQCAQPVTPADLDNAIQTLLAVKRAHSTLKP